MATKMGGIDLQIKDLTQQQQQFVLKNASVTVELTSSINKLKGHNEELEKSSAFLIT